MILVATILLAEATKPWWLYIILAILNGGVLTALFKFYKWFSRYRHEKSIVDSLAAMNEINHTMMDMVESDDPTSRVIILAGHNCGGIPQPNKPFYTSAVYWHDTHGNERKIDQYKNITVDHEYTKMLSDIIEEKKVILDVDKMKPSMLKRIYRSEGVTHSLIYFLGIADNQIFYASVASHTRPFTDIELTDIGIKMNKLSYNLFSQSNKSIFKGVRH